MNTSLEEEWKIFLDFSVRNISNKRWNYVNLAKFANVWLAWFLVLCLTSSKNIVSMFMISTRIMM